MYTVPQTCSNNLKPLIPPAHGKEQGHKLLPKHPCPCICFQKLLTSIFKRTFLSHIRVLQRQTQSEDGPKASPDSAQVTEASHALLGLSPVRSKEWRKAGISINASQASGRQGRSCLGVSHAHPALRGMVGRQGHSAPLSSLPEQRDTHPSATGSFSNLALHRAEFHSASFPKIKNRLNCVAGAASYIHRASKGLLPCLGAVPWQLSHPGAGMCQGSPHGCKAAESPWETEPGHSAKMSGTVAAATSVSCPYTYNSPPAQDSPSNFYHQGFVLPREC